MDLDSEMSLGEGLVDRVLLYQRLLLPATKFPCLVPCSLSCLPPRQCRSELAHRGPIDNQPEAEFFFFFFLEKGSWRHKKKSNLEWPVDKAVSISRTGRVRCSEPEEGRRESMTSESGEPD